MSQAEELLNLMAMEEAATHSHVVRDPDNYFMIDPDTRKMSNVTGVRNVLMQYDHNSEVYTFEVPRYVEGHDMLHCNRVRLHYINIGSGSRNRYADVVEMYDLKVNPQDNSTVISTWTIRREATQLAGTLNFLVQYMCVDDAGEVVYEWHTDIYTEVDIKTGMNNSEQAIIEYSNVLEQWYQKLFGLESSLIDTVAEATETQKAAIELKGAETLATIPEDYTTVANMAEEAVRKKANAIETEAEGEAILIDDSSDAYLLGLNLYGKTTQFATTGAQLIPYPYHNTFSTTNEVTWMINPDHTVSVTGTPTAQRWYALALDMTLPVGTYTFSGCPANGEFNKYWMYVQRKSDGYVWREYGNGATFEVTEEGLYDVVVNVGYLAGKVSKLTFYPMLNSGTEVKPFETYSEGVASPSPECPQELKSISDVTVDIYGKNLLAPRAASSSGYTATVNDDGSVTVTGSATTTNPIYLTIGKPSMENPLVLDRNQKYYMWGESSNGRFIGTKTLDSTGEAAWSTATNWNKHVGTDFMTLAQVYIESNGHEVGDTSLCGTYRFQLEVGDGFTGFEGYKERQSIELSHSIPGIRVSQNGNYTDSDGQQWVCDEIDLERGVYIQRVGTKVFDGTEDTWRLHGTLNTFMVDWPNFDGGWQLNHAMATHFICNTKAYSNEVGYFAFDNKGLGYFATGHSTIEEFRAWMNTNPVTVVCKLLSPIETPLTDEEIAYYKQLKTNYPNTTVLNDADAHMRIAYPADLKNYNHEVVEDVVGEVVTQDKIQAAVDAWLSAHYSTAEGVSF